MGAILIVEDDDDIREQLSWIMRRAGYEVLEAEDGARALEVLNKQTTPPCLMLLDLMMPVMSGPELLRTLKQRGQLDGLPVVVVSAGGMPEEAPEARAFLRKPPSPDQLRTLAKQYCGGERDAAG